MRRNRIPARGLTLLAVLLLPSCALVTSATGYRPPVIRETSQTGYTEETTRTAENFWEYAVMASDVYSTRGRSTNVSEAIANFRTKSPPPSLVDTELNCESEQRQEESLEKLIEIMKASWKRDTTIERYSPATGWLIHVPDLAIEVWNSKVYPQRYVIVFRGTSGGGGIYSNLRVIAKTIPLFVDQYRQAKSSADLIVNQIALKHGLAKMESERSCSSDAKENKESDCVAPEDPVIVSIGHSLGSALASYVFYRNQSISRTIGFNPSRFDGSWFLPREDIERFDKRFPGHDREAGDMVFINEEGQALDYLFPCRPGPAFDGPGGPSIECRTVNLTGGASLRQHSIDTLACNLAIVAQRKIKERALAKENQDDQPLPGVGLNVQNLSRLLR